jgi:hypothetical protein
MATASKPLRRVLVIPDLHLRPATNGVPTGEDTATLAAMERYVRDHKWDVVVQLGDLMDWDCISSHNANNLRAVAGKTIQREYDHANKWLDRWQDATHGALWIIEEGNHDHRVERYIDANPAMQGLMEMDLKLGLADRKIEWVRFWSQGALYKIGNAHFGHGWYTNKYHAFRTVEEAGVCVYYGHTHDVQSFSKSLRGSDKTLEAQSLGCLCRYDQPYMRGRPSKWQQAFGVFYIRPDDFFSHSVVKIFKNHFISPEGEPY